MWLGAEDVVRATGRRAGGISAKRGGLMAVLLTVLTASLGVVLLAVLAVRTVLAEFAVGREQTSTRLVRTRPVRILDLVAIALTALVLAGSVIRIVIGVLAARG
jgi:hypothetical protein